MKKIEFNRLQPFTILGNEQYPILAGYFEKEGLLISVEDICNNIGLDFEKGKQYIIDSFYSFEARTEATTTEGNKRMCITPVLFQSWIKVIREREVERPKLLNQYRKEDFISCIIRTIQLNADNEINLLQFVEQENRDLKNLIEWFFKVESSIFKSNMGPVAKECTLIALRNTLRERLTLPSPMFI